MSCPYHTSRCPCDHDSASDRYLVRMSGIYSGEFRFEFADRAEVFAIHQQTRGLKVELIDTVTTEIIVTYDHSKSGRGPALVATTPAAPGSLRDSEQRQRIDSATDDDGRFPRRSPSVADSIR